MKPWTKVLLFVGIVGLGVVIMMGLVKTRPQPGKTDNGPAAPLVETVTLDAATHRIEIDATGSVQAARDVLITAEVGGRVASVGSNFVPGGRVAAGEVLVQLEPERLELAVARAKAELARARSELALEQGRVEVAEREWTLFDDSNRNGALARREPQLAAAQANVQAAEAQLREARLNLERSGVVAPFDGVIQSEAVEAGQVINAGQQLGRLLGSERFRVQTSIPVDRLQWIDLPDAAGQGGAKAQIRQPNTRSQRQGRVVRVLGDLDPEGRMARVLVEVPDPLEGPTPLLVGAFVDVHLLGRQLDNTLAVPRAALVGQDSVWRLTEDLTLERRQLKIVWRGRDTVFVPAGDGLDAGDRIVLTRLPLAVDGMGVRLAESGTDGDA